MSCCMFSLLILMSFFSVTYRSLQSLRYYAKVVHCVMAMLRVSRMAEIRTKNQFLLVYTVFSDLKVLNYPI